VDNGMGIDKLGHQRIFDEYVQLRNPERQSEHGYGLGLAVVRELSDALPNHKISLRSALGKGARFDLTVPLIRPHADESKSPANHLPSLDQGTPTTIAISSSIQGTNVLLIEDDQTLRGAIVAQLESAGAQVRSFSSAKLALQATENDLHAPDCIISDYWLPPPLNGLEGIAVLREQFGQTVPALLISAAQDFDGDLLRNASEVEFIPKPISAQRLLEFVSNLRAMR
jgi:two-component system, sensor histidine kinase